MPTPIPIKNNPYLSCFKSEFDAIKRKHGLLIMSYHTL